MSGERESLWKFLRRKHTRHFVTRPGPEDGQATAGSLERPVMAGVDAVAGEAAHVGASQQVECWINRGRFAHDGVKPVMTGAQLRALPLPSIRDDDDLWLEVPGGEDVIVKHDEPVNVAGRRFFTVPRIINAG